MADRKLNAKMLQGAVLEAHGAGRGTIATTLNVAETTVKDWRAREDYRDEVRKLQLSVNEKLETALENLRKVAIDGFKRACNAQLEILEARDDDGDFLYPVTQRQRAAEALQNALKIVLPRERYGGDESGGNAAAAAIVIVDSSTRQVLDVEGSVVELEQLNP